MQKVLVVGGGLTGALTCALLGGASPTMASSLRTVQCWDKARGAGGRMSTTRNDNGQVDFGAQYITATDKYFEEHRPYYTDLLDTGVLTPMTCKVEGMTSPSEPVKHFVAPKGSSQIVQHFMKMGNVQASFQQKVTEISLDGGRVRFRTEKGDSDSFHIAVITMPVPQILQLSGIDTFLTEDTKQKLHQVEYSSRFCLGSFYDNPVDLGLGFAAKYISDDPVFRFLSVDNEKRGSSEEPTSVMLHTSAQFGKEHVDKSLEEMEPILSNHLRSLYPDWPVPSRQKCHKWRYSQVTKPYQGEQGFQVICESPLILLGGDGFTHSNLDGCITSAQKMAREIARRSS